MFVLSAADGCIPSDLATGTPAEIEEERRLLYVAMTRAKNFLAVVHPLRFFIRQQHRLGDRHVFTPRTRFIPDAIVDKFERVAPAEHAGPTARRRPRPARPRIDVAARLRATWATPTHVDRGIDWPRAVTNIDLVIFDLDGTLVDTAPDIAARAGGDPRRGRRRGAAAGRREDDGRRRRARADPARPGRRRRGRRSRRAFRRLPRPLPRSRQRSLGCLSGRDRSARRAPRRPASRAR